MGIKNVTVNEPFFQGHFPGRPVMPGVLIIEAMAQVGRGAGIQVDRADWKTGRLFDRHRRGEIRKPVVPGDQLRFEVDLLEKKPAVLEDASQGVCGDRIGL